MCRHWCHAFGFTKDAYCEQNCFLPRFRATWLLLVLLSLLSSWPKHNHSDHKKNEFAKIQIWIWIIFPRSLYLSSLQNHISQETYIRQLTEYLQKGLWVIPGKLRLNVWNMDIASHSNKYFQNEYFVFYFILSVAMILGM